MTGGSGREALQAVAFPEDRQSLNMVRYQVILAYDGTHFLGFQRHAAGRPGRTVQGEVETALRKLGWQGQIVLASGRTDTGVHASGQVLAFDLEWQHDVEALHRAINANLPDDIAVQLVREVSPDFHPRYDAVARHYRYHLFCRPVRDPLRERYAWRVWPAVDLAGLQQAAAVLIGVHDFAAFGSPPRPGGSTIRMLRQASWYGQEGDFFFDVVANAFLYHMVRSLVYVQVAVGQGKLPVEQVRRYLEAGQRQRSQGLAPAQGLVLVEVMY